MERAARRVQLRSGTVPAAPLQRVRDVSALCAALPVRRGQGPRRQRGGRFADPRVPAQRHRRHQEDTPRSRWPASVARRRAHRSLLLLRHRRRDPGRRDLRERPAARARAGRAASVRPRVSDLLGGGRDRRPLPRTRGVAGARRERARRFGFRATRALSRIRRSISCAAICGPLDLSLAPARPRQFRRKRLDPLPPDRVQPDAAACLCRDG